MNMTSGCTNEIPLEVTNTKNIIFLLILWSITHKNNFKLIALSFVKWKCEKNVIETYFNELNTSND